MTQLAPEHRPGGAGPGQVSFSAHIALLQHFLTHRTEIVEGIQGLLNAQRKPVDYLQDRAPLSRDFEDSLFTLAGLTHDQLRLRGQLEEAHWASGFTPRDIPGLHNGLADPAEMMVRGFHLWRMTRWPGRNGRVRYAHMLFNLYVVRCLTLLTMRIWDAHRVAPLAHDAGGLGDASERLAQVQGLLDQTWRDAPADQPVFVRDARWLVPMAQSPATDELGAYFNVAKNVAETPSSDDRIEIHRASVLMTAGHLRSQIRYYSLKKGVPLDEHSVVLITRTSNALDFALLMQDLVPLFKAYEEARSGQDEDRRRVLADAICQGISPDPELFLNRVELLGAYSMIEHLFITTDAHGQAVYSPLGQRHVQCFQEYNARIGRVSTWLAEDCPRFRPVAGAYSPYGALYGFSSNLLEHMALKTLQPDPVTRFSLEDVFASGDANTLAWVSGWRKLPHLSPEVQAQFDYPQQFADDVFSRLERALQTAVTADKASGARTGRLFVLTADHQQLDSSAFPIPPLPVQYISASDRQVVSARKAEYRDESQILSDRREGRCVISYQTSGGWVAVSKAILTEVLGAGRNALLVGLPPVVAAQLKSMHGDLVEYPVDSTAPAGTPATPG